MKGKLGTLARSFMVQAAFSYERMAGLGLSFIMRPLLRNLQGQHREAALRRSTGYFNCHPFLAGLAATALTRAELSGRSDEEIARFKRALAGPLGLIGDRFIWAGLLPSVAAIAIVLVVLGAGFLAPIAFLSVYGVINIGIRWLAIEVGDQKGIEVGRFLAHFRVKQTMTAVDGFAAFMIGLAVPMAVHWLTESWRMADIVGVILVAALGVVVSRSLFKRIDSLRFGLVTVGLALMIGWTFS